MRGVAGRGEAGSGWEGRRRRRRGPLPVLHPGEGGRCRGRCDAHNGLLTTYSPGALTSAATTTTATTNTTAAATVITILLVLLNLS